MILIKLFVSVKSARNNFTEIGHGTNSALPYVGISIGMSQKKKGG
jgi:hypothetical protein